jgi:hypothetical protein
MSEDKTVCPHCGRKMNKFKTPGESTWGETYWWVCYNNDCPYYVKGWDHMMETMKVKCSYRHRYDPDTNSCGPMPVYSEHMGAGFVVEE